MATVRTVLTINAGSSSLKAAVYAVDAGEALLAEAQVDRIGGADARLRLVTAADAGTDDRRLDASDHATALSAVLAALRGSGRLARADLIAHRVVHGGDFTAPQLVTPALLASLRRLLAVDPEHLPQALAAIETMARVYPDVPQLACFDTAFHRSMPPVARHYPLPPRFGDAGVRRYGFHGLSCEYILAALRASDAAAADGRVIIAHLGGGASLTAVHRGASVDTTMGFSPAGGLMMGTRTGDLDPGVLLYALGQDHRSAADLNRLVNRESGLLGVSGTSADMRDLLAREATDPRAASAVALFCYLAKKSLGALLAVLGGLDTLVFTGGIGERGAPIRARITAGLEEFGVVLDPARNAAHASIVSAATSRVVVRVMPTNESLVIVRHARRFLAPSGPGAA